MWLSPDPGFPSMAMTTKAIVSHDMRLACKHGAPAQVVLEGDAPNLAVTAPGATLALALMFLKTNDAAVTTAFTVPASAYALDLMRPDQVGLLSCLGPVAADWLGHSS